MHRSCLVAALALATATTLGAQEARSKWLRLERTTYHLQEPLKVHFTRPPGFPERGWVGLFEASAPRGMAANGKELAFRYLEKDATGTFECTLPDREGAFEVRLLDGQAQVDSLSLRVAFLTEGASLAMGATRVFYPGQEVAVDFTAPATYHPQAYVGLYPAAAPHAYDQASGKEVGYKYLEGKRQGTFTFPAPAALGAYEFRLYERQRLARTVAFEVAALKGDSRLAMDRRVYYPGQEVAVRWRAPAYFPTRAFVGQYPADVVRGMEANGKELGYAYLEGKTEGTYTFRAPAKAGDYEVRLLDGIQEVVALPFRVELLRGAASLEVQAVEPKVRIAFTAPGYFPEQSWVGIFPADTVRGLEANGKEKAYAYLGGKTSGVIELSPPAGDGPFEVRILDRSQEVLAVEMKPGASAKAPADPPPEPISVDAGGTPQAGGSGGDVGDELFSNFNIASVGNGPKVPTTFRLASPHQLGSLLSYHWNSKQGKAPGTLALRHESGRTFGPWQASGRPGQGGVRDANWVVEPGVELPAGEYTVVDSDPASWSWNEGSGGRGFVQVHGTPVGAGAAGAAGEGGEAGGSAAGAPDDGGGGSAGDGSSGSASEFPADEEDTLGEDVDFGEGITPVKDEPLSEAEVEDVMKGFFR